MAGTLRRVRLKGDPAIDGQVADLITLHNELVGAMESFRVQFNAANGGVVTLAEITARPLQMLQDTIRGPSGGSGTTPGQTATQIAVNAGDSQSAAVVTALTTALSVLVRDAANAAVAGVTVTWTSADNTASFAGTSTTNSSGIASCVYTTGQVVGAYTVTATVADVGAATFTATTTAGAAALLEANSVTDQSGTTSTVVGTPPSVIVKDTYGNAVAGTTVTFTVTGGGGSRSPATVDSNASGVSTLTSWTLGASAGQNTLTATAAGLTGSPVTFTANASASAPTQIAVQSGGSQTGIVAGQAASAITFRVRDAGNTAVQGVTVSFATTGTGSLSVPSAVTNASGDAAVTLTTGTTVETATVSGSFTNAGGTPVTASTTVAATFGTKTKLAITTQPASNGASGTALPGQPVITIQDANSNTVTNATDTVTAAVQSGNATISNGSTKAAVAGVATFSGLTLVDTDGGSNVLRFSSGALTTADSTGTTLTPPVPVALQFVTQPSGVTEDVANLGCAVWIVDSGSSLVPGATNSITVALTTPGGATLTGTTTANASGGIVTFSGLAVDTPGTYTLTATSTGLTSATSTSFTVSAAGGGSLTPNLPAGLTLHVDSDLSGIALNTAISSIVSTGQVAGNMGIPYDGTGGANMRIQTISDQSWRNAFHTALPACPNGYDRIHVCQFGTTSGAAYSITAGEKGRYLMNLPANTKSVYVAAYLLIGSNWYGQSGSGDWKKWYMRTTGEGPTILSFKGATTGTIRTSAYVGAHTTNITGATDTSLTEAADFNNMATMTRNTWYLVEGLFVTESSSNAGDAHMTYWVDGVKKFQITACRLTTGGGGNLTWSSSSEILHYYGGGGTTNVPVNNGPLLVATGDHMKIYTSTSRVAVP